MNTEQKLNILTESSKFDLSCSCKTSSEEGRVRGAEGKWIYPAVLPSGRKTFLLKTLQSNACVNDCSYCPFNASKDVRRCTLSPDQLAKSFIELRNMKLVEGLFLSSGVCGSADKTMADMLATVEILRKRYRFKGYIHLKVIPGASAAAIEQAVNLATRVSVNIEAPNAKRLGRLSAKKNFHDDILSAMGMIKDQRDHTGHRVSQTTQFVVGAAGESDKEIVVSTDSLYKGYRMERVYFSAYQDYQNEGALVSRATEQGVNPVEESFVREHRLYQVDFLLRKYFFDVGEIHFDENDRLSLAKDPKEIWADLHPEVFPIDPNRADYETLLRVPGIGPIGAKRIIKARRVKSLRYVEDLAGLHVRYAVAGNYLKLKRRQMQLF